MLQMLIRLLLVLLVAGFLTRVLRWLQASRGTHPKGPSDGFRSGDSGRASRGREREVIDVGYEDMPSTDRTHPDGPRDERHG